MILALGGCANVPAADAESPADLAVLADRADRLADQLDAGDGCAAEREAAELVALARDGVAAGDLHQETAAEVIDVVEEIASTVACEDDAEEGDPAEEGPDEEPGEGRGSGNGGNGNEGKGNEGKGNGEGPPGRSEEGPPGQRGSSDKGRGGGGRGNR
jgi:hypothetical protein